jgi:hypothetical protein
VVDERWHHAEHDADKQKRIKKGQEMNAGSGKPKLE